MSRDLMGQLAVVKARLEQYTAFTYGESRFLRDALVIIIQTVAGELVPPETRLGDGPLSTPVAAPTAAPVVANARPGYKPIEVGPGNIQWVPEDSPVQSLDDLLGAGVHEPQTITPQPILTQPIDVLAAPVAQPQTASPQLRIGKQIFKSEGGEG